MDIGTHAGYVGSPVLLTLVLLVIIPSSHGYIDCRISCRRCHENTEHPAVLEVYCAMCEECKQRRRERMQGRTTKGKVKPTLKPLEKSTLKPLAKLTKTKQLARMRNGVDAIPSNDEATMLRPQETLQYQQGQQEYLGQPLEQQQPFEQQQQLFEQQQEAFDEQQLAQHLFSQPPELQISRPFKPKKRLRQGFYYPVGCPTPPICSDTDYTDYSEEKSDKPSKVTLKGTTTTTEPTTTTTEPTTTTTEPTTTTTEVTTTMQPCPPVTPCRKKPKKKRLKQPLYPPCMTPCMVPPHMAPPHILPPPMVHPPMMSPPMMPPQMCPCPINPPQPTPNGQAYMPPYPYPYYQTGFSWYPPTPQPLLPSQPTGPEIFATDKDQTPKNGDYESIFLGVPREFFN